MKVPLLRASLWMLFATAFPITSTYSHAEAHCPAGVAALHPRLVAGALLVIPVRINQSGPYDFMVDTGSQLNIVDPALAASLVLKSERTVGLITATDVSHGSVSTLNSLEAGGYTLEKPIVVVQDMSAAIQAADPDIRGVLGENFLAHFDVLIDYRRGLLCLDQAKLMEKDLRGERVPLVTSNHSQTEMAFFPRLVISVKLTDTGSKPILLQLDSGSDGQLLYAGKRDLEQSLLRRARMQGPEVGEARRAFALLPPQDMQIGTRVVRKVPFVTPVHAVQNVPDREEDGLLATVLFQRVYVSHSDGFVIFDPR